MYREMNSTIPYLNCGGCGAVALATYEVSKDYDPKIVYVHEDTLCKVSDSAYHVVVKIGDFYYDSGGRYTSTGFNKIWSGYNKTVVPVSYLVKAVNRATLWNHLFNRRYLVSIIKITNRYKRK